MTPSELKYQIETHRTETLFFSRENMRFAGDRMSNFGVRSTVITAMTDTVNPDTGKYEFAPTEVWELYRRRPVKTGRGSFYFRKADFSRCFSVEE